MAQRSCSPPVSGRSRTTSGSSEGSTTQSRSRAETSEPTGYEEEDIRGTGSVRRHQRKASDPSAYPPPPPTRILRQPSKTLPPPAAAGAIPRQILNHAPCSTKTSVQKLAVIP